MAAQPKPRISRQSWATYDARVEKACAKRDGPHPTSSSPEPTAHPTEPDALPDNALDPLWEKVWDLKAKQLEALPSKVKSLDVGRRTSLQKEGEGKIGIKEVSHKDSASDPINVETARGEKSPKLKRKSSATFRVSEDGRSVTASFDMLGVHKHDMHVSFRSNWVVVTWRRLKVTEKMEDGVLVRERKEKQYCQSIPIPEGACFENVRASRDGHLLMITYPNSRCVRIEPPLPVRIGYSSAETSMTVCSEEADFQTCKLAPSTLEVFEVERLES